MNIPPSGSDQCASFVGCLLIVAQGPVYAKLAADLGRNYLAAVFLAFLVATLATGLALVGLGRPQSITVTTLRGLPAWPWLGGLFGAIHVVISMQSIPVVGISVFTCSLSWGASWARRSTINSRCWGSNGDRSSGTAYWAS